MVKIPLLGWFPHQRTLISDEFELMWIRSGWFRNFGQNHVKGQGHDRTNYGNKSTVRHPLLLPISWVMLPTDRHKSIMQQTTIKTWPSQSWVRQKCHRIKYNVESAFQNSSTRANKKLNSMCINAITKTMLVSKQNKWHLNCYRHLIQQTNNVMTTTVQ